MVFKFYLLMSFYLVGTGPRESEGGIQPLLHSHDARKYDIVHLAYHYRTRQNYITMIKNRRATCLFWIYYFFTLIWLY